MLGFVYILIIKSEMENSVTIRPKRLINIIGEMTGVSEWDIRNISKNNYNVVLARNLYYWFLVDLIGYKESEVALIFPSSEEGIFQGKKRLKWNITRILFFLK